MEFEVVGDQNEFDCSIFYFFRFIYSIFYFHFVRSVFFSILQGARIHAEKYPKCDAGGFW